MPALLPQPAGWALAPLTSRCTSGRRLCASRGTLAPVIAMSCANFILKALGPMSRSSRRRAVDAEVRQGLQ